MDASPSLDRCGADAWDALPPGHARPRPRRPRQSRRRGDRRVHRGQLSGVASGACPGRAGVRGRTRARADRPHSCVAVRVTLDVACEAEDRVLLTLDMHFADTRRYDPSRSPGVLVLRPRDQSIRAVLQCLDAAVRALSVQRVRASLWIMDPEGRRIRDHPTVRTSFLSRARVGPARGQSVFHCAGATAGILRWLTASTRQWTPESGHPLTPLNRPPRRQSDAGGGGTRVVGRSTGAMAAPQSALPKRKPPDHRVAGRTNDIYAHEARGPARYAMRRRASTPSASSPDAMSASEAGSGTVVLGIPSARINSA